MAISLFGSFRSYAVLSLFVTTVVISHSFYTKRFFYRSIVHLAKNKFAILSVANMALVSVLWIWRIIKGVFLGQLRFRERERLQIRGRDALIESCFAMSVFRDEFTTLFVALITTLLLVKSLHWLCKDRIEFLEEQPLSPRRQHIRLICLMALLLCIDVAFVARSIMLTFNAKVNMFALFAFEYSILIVELVSDFVRYIFLVIDLQMDGRWDSKSLYSFYIELLSDLCQLILYLIFFIYVHVKYSFPYHIIREMYMTFHKFRRRFFDFLRYRRVVATMNELFADATPEQLAEGDSTCIICREEMTAAKVLTCGHMFHARCLQSWLKRQLSCPICRANIDVNPPPPPPAAGPNNADNVPPRQLGQPGQPGQPGLQQQQAQGQGQEQAARNGGIAMGAGQVGNMNMGAGGGVQVGVDVGAQQLLNMANNWWQGVINNGAPRPAAAAAPPPPPPAVVQPPAGPHQQGIGQLPPPHLAPTLGPRPAMHNANAAAHIQLRRRRRLALDQQLPMNENNENNENNNEGVDEMEMNWNHGFEIPNLSYYPPPPLPIGMNMNMNMNIPSTTMPPLIPILPPLAAAALPLPPPPPPRLHAAAGGIDTARLLHSLVGVQEQIEVLRAQVESVVMELTTNETAVILNEADAIRREERAIAMDEGRAGNGNDVEERETQTGTGMQTQRETAGTEIVDEEDEGQGARGNGGSGESEGGEAVVTEVVEGEVEGDEEEDEAARIRRRRMDFLERQQRSA